MIIIVQGLLENFGTMARRKTLFSYYQPFHLNTISDIDSPEFIKLNLSMQYFVERLNKT